MSKIWENVSGIGRKLFTIWPHVLLFFATAASGFIGFNVWQWFDAANSATPPATQEAASAIVRNYGLILVGIIGFILAVIRLRFVDRQHTLDKRSELFDRFQRSSAMLDSKNQALRQAGMAVLAEIASEEPTEFYDRVNNLLCSFLRQASDEQRALAEQMGISKTSGSAKRPDWPKPRADMVEAIKQLSALRSGSMMGDIEGGNPNSKADLEGLFVPGFKLSEIVFCRCNLSRAVFTDTVQYEVLYQHCDMEKTLFERAKFGGCVFQYCTAKIVSFSRCLLIQTIKIGGTFNHVIFDSGYADQKTIEQAKEDGPIAFRNPTYTNLAEYRAAMTAAQYSEAPPAYGPS